MMTRANRPTLRRWIATAMALAMVLSLTAIQASAAGAQTSKAHTGCQADQTMVVKTTAALQSALRAPGSGDVVLAAGEYRVGATLTVSGTKHIVVANGATAVVKRSPKFTGTMVQVPKGAQLILGSDLAGGKLILDGGASFTGQKAYTQGAALAAGQALIAGANGKQTVAAVTGAASAPLVETAGTLSLWNNVTLQNAAKQTGKEITTQYGQAMVAQQNGGKAVFCGTVSLLAGSTALSAKAVAAAAPKAEPATSATTPAKTPAETTSPKTNAPSGEPAASTTPTAPAEPAAPTPAANTGKLTVHNVVTGSNGDTNQEFHFKIHLESTAVDGKYGEMTFTKGETEITLKHNQTATADNLPEGVKYTVTETEANKDGYTTTATGSEGTTTSGEVHVVFTNDRSTATPPAEKTYDLTVKNVLSGTAADYQDKFTFRVILSNLAINGVYGDMTFSKGIAEVTLVGGQSATAKGLPDGIGYRVVETEANKDGYTTTATGDTGTISGKNVEAVFTNTKNSESAKDTYALTVRAVISGSGADKNKYFSFQVTLNDKSIDGTYGEMKFEDGVAEFPLKGGYSVTAAGIPEGTGYTVKQLDAGKDGYTTKYSNASGTIRKNTEVTVTNSKSSTTTKTYDLTVKNVVTGTGADKDAEFTFTIQLGDKTISGKYGDMTFSKGRVVVKLEGGESATADNLPSGTSYTVTQAKKTGYSTKASNAKGTLSSKNITATFTNTKISTKDSSPKTDDPSQTSLYLGLSLAGVGGAAALVILRAAGKKKGEE